MSIIQAAFPGTRVHVHDDGSLDAATPFGWLHVDILPNSVLATLEVEALSCSVSCEGISADDAIVGVLQRIDDDLGPLVEACAGWGTR